MQVSAMAVPIVLLALVAGCAAADAGNATRAQVTRTSLHVGRSLDPDSMQTLNVRTKGGGVATLLVKRRDGKSGRMPAPVSVRSTPLRLVDGDKSPPAATSVSTGVVSVRDGGKPAGKSIAATPLLLLGDGRKDAPPRPASVPGPVYVRSSPMYVKGEKQSPWKRQRSLMTIDSDGTPVITGVRMPDDASDVFTWRNARVVNNFLVPNDSDGSSVASQADAQKRDVVKKNLSGQPQEEAMDDRFQPVAVIRPATPENYRTLSSESYSRILEYINTVNQRESRQREAEIRSRMVHYPVPRYNLNGVSTPTVLASSRFQPRMLHYQGSSVYPASLLYTPQNAKPSRVSFEEGVRTPVLQYAHPELGVQTAKIERKQDDVVEETKLQRAEAVGEIKSDPLAMAYFSQDIHSDRSPYAYEPGLLSSYDEKDTNTENKDTTYDKRSSSVEANNYNQWPRSPLALLNHEDSYGLRNEKYIRRYPYNGYSDAYYGKDSMNTLKGPTVMKMPQYSSPNRYSTMFVHVDEERPFWEKLGETIREHVHSSMEKVSELARPVMEPLVEATHKISQNLGLTPSSADQGKIDVIQDKVGGAVAAYPVFLPALGLVAGGAALGLGAVAVGRYLDVDIMKSRTAKEETESEDLAMEHKRALDSIVKQLSGQDPSSQGAWIVTKQPDTQEEVDIGKLSEEVSESVLGGKAADHGKTKRSLEEGTIYIIEEPPAIDLQDANHALGKRDGVPMERSGDVVVGESHAVSKRSAPVDEAAGGDPGNLLTSTAERSSVEALVTMAGLGHPGHWRNTSCAKKIFCEVMVRQPADSIVLMEKKMAFFSSLVHASDEVASHLRQVMDAVRSEDCSPFRCDAAPR